MHYSKGIDIVKLTTSNIQCCQQIIACFELSVDYKDKPFLIFIINILTF